MREQNNSCGGARGAGPDLEKPSGEGSCRDGLVPAMVVSWRVRGWGGEGKGRLKGNKNKKKK